MAPSDIRAYLRATNAIKADRTDEDIDEEVSQNGGLPRMTNTDVS
jgi:hypothetical protein